MKYDVFVSYSRKDKKEVESFIKQLKKRIPGIKIWYDIDGIESGEEFKKKIMTSIDNSLIILFALSDNSLVSDWASKEVMYAKNTHKKVVPLLLKGAELKSWFLFEFGEIDCIDITNKTQVNKFVSNLKGWTHNDEPIVPVDQKQDSASTQAKSSTDNTVTIEPDNVEKPFTEDAGNNKPKDTLISEDIKPIGKDDRKYLNLFNHRIAKKYLYAGVVVVLLCIIVPFSISLYQNYIDKNAYNVACEYYESENYQEAVKWFTKAAELGNAEAQYNLGNCYDNGRGVPQSYKEAVKWYTKAAEQGYAYAQYNLGICYENGDGVPQSDEEAIKWYTKAAEQGLKVAQENLDRLTIPAAERVAE